MLRATTAISLTLLILLVTFSATGTGRRRADFTYVNRNGVHTLDPAQMSWNQDIRLAINIWEGLTTYDPRTAAPMEGAAHFPPHISDDGRVYTFTLREDGRWSNGDPVTARDFLRGWRRAIEPGTAGDYAAMLTDYIRGAADYYRWRNRGVAVLTVLATLRDGRPIDHDQRRTLVTAGVLSNEDAATVSGSVASGGRNWGAMHAAYRRRHQAQMDRRFADVSIRALDDRTLRVELRRPCTYFLDLCAFCVFLPIHHSIELLRERSGAGDLTDEGLVAYDPQWTKPDYHRNGYPGLVTNGPYRVAEWVFKRHLRLTINPHYAGAPPSPQSGVVVRQDPMCQTIDMLVYDDLNTAVLAYEAGEIDFLPSMSVDYDHELARLALSGARPDFAVPLVFGTYFYVFNCRGPEFAGRPNPFTDARVRRAFAMTVDKDALVGKVVARGERAMRTLVPPETIVGYRPPEGIGFDPPAARRLLAEAGYPQGAGLPVIDLLYNSGSQHGSVCEALAQMWQEHLGVRVALRGKEAKTFAEDKVRGQYMIARAGWYGDYGDPTTFLDIFATGNGNNDAGYSADDYDALLVRAAREVDVARRFALLREAERILVERDLPLLPLYQYTNLCAVRPRVHGLHLNRRLIFPFRFVRTDR